MVQHQKITRPNIYILFWGGIVADINSSEYNSRRSIERIKKLSISWAALVGLVLLFQAYTYSGLYAQLAEWQFLRFERLFPFSSLALTTLVFSLPLLIFLWVRRRRHRKLYGAIQHDIFISRLQKIFGIFRNFAIVAFVISVIFFIIALRAPNYDSQSTQSVTATNPIVTNTPVQMDGSVLYNRVAAYSQKTFLTRRDLLLAPVTLNETDKTFSYFLVIKDRSQVGPARDASVKGFARKVKLPGGFRVLFDNAGYDVAQDTYLIFDSAEAARKRQFGLVETTLRLGILLLIGMLISRLVLRKYERKD